MPKRSQSARKAVKKSKAPAPRRQKTANAGANQETAKLKRELSEALERQKATGEILAAISNSTSDLQSILDAIVRTASRLCGAEYALIYRLQDGKYHTAASNNTAADFVKYAARHPLAPSRGSLVGRTALERKTVHLPDCLADPEYEARDYQQAGRYRTSLGVPLQQGGVAIGVIVLMRARVKPFSDRQIDLVTTFANQASIAIENARLFHEVKARTEDLRESLRQQTATAEVLKVISRSTFDLQAVLDELTRSAAKLCDADMATITRQGADGHFYHVTNHNFPPDWVEYIREVSLRPSRGSVVGRTLLEKKAVQVSDVTADPEYIYGEQQKKAGFRTFLGVPLLREGEPIGVFSLCRKTVAPFLEKQIELLSSFADQAVIAIENVRLFDEVKARTEDLRESLQQQTATADVLKVISRSAFDLQTVLETLVESAALLCGADIANIWRPKEDAFHLVASFSVSGKDKARKNNKEYLQNLGLTPGRGSIVGRTLNERRVVQIEDVKLDNDYQLSEVVIIGDYRTLLGVPLLREGLPIGVMVLVRCTVQPFTERQIQLVSTFADQAVIAIENVRLFDEVKAKTEDLRESLQQQTATADVLKVISRSTFDLQTVLDTLVESVTRLCEADHAWLFQRDGDLLHFKSSFGHGTATHDRIRELFFRREVPIDRGSITGRSALEGRVVHVPDVLQDREYAWNEAQKIGGYRAALGAPLLRDGRVVGVIFVAKIQPEPFSDKQVELVTTFADQAVIAIENVRLFNETQEALRYQTGSANILTVIASSPTEVEPVLKAIVESACELCEAYDAAALLQDGEDLRFSAHHGPIPIGLEKWPINRNWTAGRAFIDQKAVHIHDLRDEANAAYTDGREMSLRMGHRTILSVPLVREDESIGAIVLRRTEVHPFTEKQIALLKSFANQAVIAIQNVRLFDEVQARTRDLDESLQQQTATADVLKTISRSTFDLQSVLRTLVESAARLSEADKATITRQKGCEFFRAESFGFSDEFMNYVRSVPVTLDRGSATGRALLDGVVVHIPDVAADAEYTFSEGQKLGDFRCLLGVPMMREGIAVGVIVLTRQEPRPFTDKQIELVTTFADQAAIAIENVRLFDEVQERTRELSLSLNELRTAQDRLVQTEKLASLGQLTAGIAHEIKNPLNFVNNFSALSAELIDELKDLLKSASLDDKTREEIDELTQMLKSNLEKVVQHGERADSIVKNMLLHSREGSGERRLADINAIVEESLNLAYHGARAEKSAFNITLQREFDPAAGLIDLYPQEITRVLLNLISNGFYAATKRKEEGEEAFEPVLSATTKNLGNEVEIRIRDNGTGIPLEVKEKMFNPFFTTKPAGEGTGLGLSMSHDIVVKQHGGKIDVISEPGVFTEFIVTLTRTAAQGHSGGVN